MAAQGVPKMSLVAQYDDLCRYTKVLVAGCEEEFKTYVENQLQFWRKKNEAENEMQALKGKIVTLENDKKKLETQMRHLRSLVESEMLKREHVEKERNSLEMQIRLIKEVLLADGNIDNNTKEKLVFLSSKDAPPCLETIQESYSMVSLSDIDKTGDDLESNGRRSSKRRSSGDRRSLNTAGFQVHGKKKKIESESKLEDVPVEPFTSLRSYSEPNNSEVQVLPKNTHKSDSEQMKYNTYNLRRTSAARNIVSTPVSRYSVGSKLNRAHTFVTKTVIRTEKCFSCNHLIKFCKQALRCQDCRVVCHPECKEQCPLPCIPTSSYTPTKDSAGSLSDYVNSTHPMIPALIILSINEIEMRGLKEIGLYRISGSEREVKELKEKFLKGRSVPNLSQYDIHAICGTVKEFLRSLKEPLIPNAAWQTFVDAAELPSPSDSMNALYDAVLDLPQANQDTLCFLILHLQRIAESPDCKMPIENLAKVFGPTVVGYSVPDLPNYNMLSETTYQYKVMERLLKIPTDSWQNLLNVDGENGDTNAFYTPEPTSAQKVSRLAPFSASGQKTYSGTLKTSGTPRSTKPTGKKFFSSPLLKLQ